MVTGVYTITNIKNNKIYVGSTTVSFTKRWNDHKSALNTNRHSNTHLQKAWNKYGEDSFLFEVLSEVEPELCLSEEQYWINMLGVYKYGYNRCPVAGNTKGTKRSEEVLKKMRNTDNYKKANKAWSGKTHTEAARLVMSKKAKLRDNSYLHTEEVRKKISQKAKKRIETGWKTPGRTGTGKYGKCEQFDMDGNYIKTFNTVYEAFRSLGLKNASHIIRASKNFNSKSCSGFRWKVYTLDDEWFK